MCVCSIEMSVFGILVVCSSTCRGTDSDSVAVAEVVASFITIMDACKLQMVAVDQVGVLWMTVV